MGDAGNGRANGRAAGDLDRVLRDALASEDKRLSELEERIAGLREKHDAARAASAASPRATPADEAVEADLEALEAAAAASGEDLGDDGDDEDDTLQPLPARTEEETRDWERSSGAEDSGTRDWSSEPGQPDAAQAWDQEGDAWEEPAGAAEGPGSTSAWDDADASGSHEVRHDELDAEVEATLAAEAALAASGHGAYHQDAGELDDEAHGEPGGTRGDELDAARRLLDQSGRSLRALRGVLDRASTRAGEHDAARAAAAPTTTREVERFGLERAFSGDDRAPAWAAELLGGQARAHATAERIEELLVELSRTLVSVLDRPLRAESAQAVAVERASEAEGMIADLEARAESAEDDLAGAEHRAESAESRAAAAEDRAEQLEARAAELEARALAAERGATALRSQMAAHTDRLGQLEQLVQHLAAGPALARIAPAGTSTARRRDPGASASQGARAEVPALRDPKEAAPAPPLRDPRGEAQRVPSVSTAWRREAPGAEAAPAPSTSPSASTRAPRRARPPVPSGPPRTPPPRPSVVLRASLPTVRAGAQPTIEPPRSAPRDATGRAERESPSTRLKRAMERSGSTRRALTALRELVEGEAPAADEAPSPSQVASRQDLVALGADHQALVAAHAGLLERLVRLLEGPPEEPPVA